MEKTGMTEIVSSIAQRNLPGDAFLWGIADMRGLLPEAYAPYPSALSIAYKLDKSVMDNVWDGPSRAYLAHYHEANARLAAVADAIAMEISASGIQSLAVPPTNTDAQLDQAVSAELRAPISHKMAATRSGLGWIGKTDLLVTPQAGPRVRLATVLIGATLEVSGPPYEESACGSCRRCVDACPARAANGLAWKAGMAREEFYDAYRCRETCRMLSRVRLGETISICGICVSTCPFGRKSG
jgi:epoxyqueuosine reductase QueG